MRLNLGSTSARRKDLKSKATRLGLFVQIENYGKCSVYRFSSGEYVIFSAIGLREAFTWLSGYHSGSRSSRVLPLVVTAKL